MVASVLALLASAGVCVRADDPFSPKAIFMLSAHRDIDDRCPEARKFADRVAADDPAAPDIGAGDAYAGARAFGTCFYLPRLNPDDVKQRYLYLATATCMYMAGSRLQGHDADRLLSQASIMAREIGAVGPDRTVVIEHVVQGAAPNSAMNPVPVNPTHEYYEVERSPFGMAHAGPFTSEANKLLAAINAYYERMEQSERPQAVDASPVAPQSSAPAPPQPK
jgi:hypothetical protein